MHLRRPLLALLALALAWGIVPSASGGSADSTTLGSRVDTFVGAYLDRHRLPGATVAVVHDGRVVHESGYGHDADGRDLTATTRMRLASGSKPVTALAVLQLVQDGRVDLDAPVVRYLPDFETEDGREDGVTVRHLLAQTSGLPNPTVVPPARTLREAAERTRSLRLSTAPGTRYAYSNANYWVAARLVEVVSGRDFSSYLRDRVFAPLGMERSVNRTNTADAVPGLARGHVTAWGGSVAVGSVDQTVSGAGGVISTAHDMGLWLAAQQRDGRAPDGTSVLSPGLVRESHHAQPGTDGVGLGWDGDVTESGRPRVGYSGVDASGWSSRQDLVPGTGYGVVVLANSTSPTIEHPYELSSGVLELTEGGEPDLGTPVAVLVDLALGATTLLVLAAGVVGVGRAGRWAARRRGRRAWRSALRLVPLGVAPAAAVALFGVAPSLQDNSLTPTDVFWLFPSATGLLAALAAASTAVLVTRGWWMARRRPARGTVTT